MSFSTVLCSTVQYCTVCDEFLKYCALPLDAIAHPLKLQFLYKLMVYYKNKSAQLVSCPNKLVELSTCELKLFSLKTAPQNRIRGVFVVIAHLPFNFKAQRNTYIHKSICFPWRYSISKAQLRVDPTRLLITFSGIESQQAVTQANRSSEVVNSQFPLYTSLASNLYKFSMGIRSGGRSGQSITRIRWS